MCKFTKGEWKVHSVGSQFAVGPLSSVDDQSNGMMNAVAWIEKFDYFTEEQQEYNAYLIAAAPEMYEFLENMKSYLNDCCKDAKNKKYMVIAIEELLTKARGEHV